MNLSKKIIEAERDNSGSMAKNRLSFQISYGVKLIMDFYDSDFILLMDYIEDIAVISNPENPDAIRLYQVKTKGGNGTFTLHYVIQDKWFQKLYKNSVQYGEYLLEGNLVCNADIVENSKSLFENENNKLTDLINTNVECKIRKAIAEDQKVVESDIDLSKFWVVRSEISTKNHKEDIMCKFETFLVDRKSDIQVDMARAVYNTIYTLLDDQFNNELSSKNQDMNEIIRKKGVISHDIVSLVEDAISLQIPSNKEVYDLFEIKDITICRKYNSAYTKLKTDWHSNRKTFTELKKQVYFLIEQNPKIGDCGILANIIYDELSQMGGIPLPYKDEYYLRLIIMIMVMKYRAGC